MDEKVQTRSKSRWLLVAVAASVTTAAICAAAFASIFYGTGLCNDKPLKEEKFLVHISDSPSAAKVEVYRPDKLIVTETKTEGSVHHTMTVQDYSRGMQAVKDLNRNQCFVLPVFAPFEEVVKVAEGQIPVLNDKPQIQLQKTAPRETIPREYLSLALGKSISYLCKDVPTFWLVDASKPGLVRQKRLAGATLSIVCLEILVF